MLGRDFSGVVLDVGSKVKQFEAGDSGNFEPKGNHCILGTNSFYFYFSVGCVTNIYFWKSVRIHSRWWVCRIKHPWYYIIYEKWCCNALHLADSRSVRLKPHLLDHLGAATLPFSSLQVYGKHFWWMSKRAPLIALEFITDAFVNQGSIQPFHGFHSKRILVVDGGSPTGCIAVQVSSC